MPDSDIADKDAAAPMPSVADRSPSQPSRTRSPSQQAAAASTSTTPNTNQQPGRSATHANPAGAQQQRTRSRPPQGSKPSHHQPAAALQTPSKTTTPPPADPSEELKTPPDGENGPLQEEQEVIYFQHPTIQLARSTTSKHRPPLVHARQQPDPQGPLTDRIAPSPQTKPPPLDHLANLHHDNILVDNFTTPLTETNSIIDAVTSTVLHRSATLDQHVQNEGPDFSPYVLTLDSTDGEDAKEDPNTPFPAEPMNSPHQQIRGTAFTRQ